jgi:thymidylate synthase ThyX
MGFKASVILDSVSNTGARLITMELTYPRFIHAEFMTHRMFSRNAASSRAIPTRKMIKMVESDPAMPVYWGKNKKGMSAVTQIEDIGVAEGLWINAKDEAVRSAQAMYELGVHKQIVNRVLEPWKYITVICTATEWSNFFGLRRHEDAQPEIHHLADMMFEAQKESKPKLIERNWHMPYMDSEDTEVALDLSPQSVAGAYDILRQASVARCARVSYLTHDGKRDLKKDLILYQRLLTGSGHGHWSPFEHVARPFHNPERRSGNFVGWQQYRKIFKGESQ